MAHSLALSMCFPAKAKEEEKQDLEVYQKYAEIAKTLPEARCWPSAPLHKYQGFWFTSGQGLECVMAAQEHFTSRNGDILLATLPKVGTTWLKALAFAVANRTEDSPFSMSALLSHNPHECVPLLEMQCYDGQRIPNLDALPTPRLLATHMHHHMLPGSVVDPAVDCKIIYLCRNPRDTFISAWKFFNNMLPPNMSVGLETALDCFLAGIHWGGPFWDHVRGYWNASRKNPQRVLFLRYEEIQRDPTTELKRLAAFMECPFSPEEEEEGGVVDKIVDMCSIKNLSNLNVNRDGAIEAGIWKYKNSAFFRKGVVGDWANYLTPEMVERLDRVVDEKLQGSHLSFTGSYDP